MSGAPRALSTDLLSALRYPIDVAVVLRKRKALRDLLLERPPSLASRIAILGGSTTGEVKPSLELFLLDHFIQPEFYEGAYGRFYEEALFENPELDSFRPQIAYIHTTCLNIRRFPPSVRPPKRSRLMSRKKLAGSAPYGLSLSGNTDA